MKVDPMLHPLEGIWRWISLLARYAVAFGAIVFITGLLYYFGPNRRQRWHRVWPGAILATILWLAFGVMPHVDALHQEQHVLGDVGGVIGDALQVARHRSADPAPA